LIKWSKKYFFPGVLFSSHAPTSDKRGNALPFAYASRWKWVLSTSVAKCL
jgi:hypothetical protein